MIVAIIILLFITALIFLIRNSQQDVKHEWEEHYNKKSEPLSKPKRTENLLTVKINSVAIQIANKEKFTAAAKKVAIALPFDQAVGLLDYQHNTPEPPKQFTEELKNYPPLGSWMSICQHAIYEILYHYKEEAYETIRTIAFGVYDWTQINALDVLMRWAKEGIRRNEIIEEILAKFPRFREEAQIPCMQMLNKLDKDDRIDAFFENEFIKLLNEQDHELAAETVQYWLKKYPTSVAKQRQKIEDAAYGIGYREKPLSHVSEENYEKSMQYLTWHKERYSMEFLLILYQLDKENKDVISKIEKRKAVITDEHLLRIINYSYP